MDPLRTMATAVGLFAGTNIDDLIVLTVLFLSARAVGKPEIWQIWPGNTSASLSWSLYRRSRPWV